MSENIMYFRTYDQAFDACKAYDKQEFHNVYQFKGESVKAEVKSFKLGYAIQFGDCGPYLTAEFRG